MISRGAVSNCCSAPARTAQGQLKANATSIAFRQELLESRRDLREIQAQSRPFLLPSPLRANDSLRLAPHRACGSMRSIEPRTCTAVNSRNRRAMLNHLTTCDHDILSAWPQAPCQGAS